MPPLLITLLAAVSGIGLGYGIRVWMSSLQFSQMERDANQLLKDAKKDADNILKESDLRAKAEVLKAREEFEVSTKSRRDELSLIDNRIVQREANLERKVAMIEKKERTVDQRSDEVEKHAADTERVRLDLTRLIDEEKTKLQRIAGMTEGEARQTLMNRVESEVHNEIGGLIRRLQEEAKLTADREAQKIVSLAIQR